MISFCSLNIALEYLVYSSSILSMSNAGFTVAGFDRSGFIRIRDEVSFVFAYSEARDVPNECAIIIGFEI